MPTPIEKNLPYPYPQDLCYSVIKDDVIPNLRVEHRIGFLNRRIPNGSIGLSIIDDDWRAYKLIAKLKYIGLLTYTWGPPIKIYSRSTGPDTTIVEIVADAAKFYDGQFMNFMMDVTYKRLPVYSWFVRKVIPDIYFDETRIIDSKKLEQVSFRDELGRTALDHVFQKTHELLEKKLKQQKTTF